MSTVERKPTGPQFPGYWKGTDPASKAKDKMVGGAEESVIKDLHSTAKKKVTEWQLQEKYAKFKEQDSNAYTGIDPIVRQRLGMQPATQDQIRTYLDNNPPVLKTGDGEPVRSGSGATVGSAGQIDVAKAADAVSPDRAQNVAREPSPAVASATTSAALAATAAAPVGGLTAAELAAEPVGGSTAGAAPAAAVARPVADRDITSVTPDVSTSVFPVYKPAADGAGAAAGTTAPAPVRAPYRGSSSAREIQSVNPFIKDVNKIKPGQRLKLPDSDEDYVVQRGDTLDKIGKMYRSGEIGGRVVGGDGPTTAPAARPAPAAPVAPSTSGSQPAVRPDDRAGRGTGRVETPSAAPAASRPRNRPSSQAPIAVPPTSFDPPGRDTDTSDRPAPATRSQPAAPASTQTSATAPAARPPSDAMASYATRGGRVYAADFNNPSGIGWDGKGKYTSYKTPEEGVNATRDLVARYLTDQTPFIKGSPTPDQVVSTWVTGGKTPADKIQGGRYLQSVNDELAAAGVKLDAKGRIPYSQAARDAITRAIIRHETAPKHMEKFAPFLTAPKDAKGSIEESNKEDEKIAGRYDPDDFDLMVKRLGQRAREQDRKHGPVDIAALAKRLRELEKRHQTNEVEDPAINTQDPDIQKTSQTSPQQDPAAVRQQQLDQTVDMATAKGTMTGLKNVLGPKVDTNALASAVTKISDGKPLSGPESMSMSALTPLISKAAETPQTAMALKTALSNAGMLSKQGK